MNISKWVIKFSYFINLFKNRKVTTCIVDDVVECKQPTREELISKLDLKKFGKPEYVNGYDPNRKTVIIVDDMEQTKALYEITFKDIIRYYELNVLKEYNIIYFFGKNVGFTVLDFLNSGVKIDFAILDVTISTIAKVEDEFIEVDGVDLSIAIDKLYPDYKVMFNSAHTMNTRNPTVRDFMLKFKTYFGDNMNSYSIDKLADRKTAIYNLINIKG